ncbi:MAG TPA: MFS transporter [Thermoanaerobaculia bacterium]|nr:MFS transporter [Thermoanaerobaculia bacterium]
MDLRRRRGWVERVPVRAGERGRVALSAFYFFALLSSYSILRPVRDEIGVRAGVSKVPWLFTGTLASMLLLVPVFGWISSRFARRRFLPGIQFFFAGNLALFAAVLGRPGAARLAAPAFFIWVAVFNLFAVSLSWSLMSDLYRGEQARRLFGIVAAGGSLGALAGPAAMAALAPRVGTGRLLFAASILLAACAGTARVLQAGVQRSGEAPPEAPIGGATLAAIRRTLRSRFLLVIALTLVCYTTLSTLLYFSQTELVGAAIHGSGERVALFARMDLAVNALTILFQLFVAGPLIRRAGVGGALAIVAAAVTAGVLILGFVPILTTVVAVQILHRVGHFGVGRPARETLFVALDVEDRYKSKSFIDTAVYRGSDAASAWLLGLFRSQGLGLAQTALLCVPVGVVWAAASWWLGGAGEAAADGERGASAAERLEPA